MKSKARQRPAHKTPFLRWVAGPHEKVTGYEAFFTTAYLLLKEGWSRAEIFRMLRVLSEYVVDEPPISEREMSGIIDLVCIGEP